MNSSGSHNRHIMAELRAQILNALTTALQLLAGGRLRCVIGLRNDKSFHSLHESRREILAQRSGRSLQRDNDVQWPHLVVALATRNHGLQMMLPRGCGPLTTERDAERIQGDGGGLIDLVVQVERTGGCNVRLISVKSQTNSQPARH